MTTEFEFSVDNGQDFTQTFAEQFKLSITNHTVQLPDELGSGSIKEVNLDNGISLCLHQYELAQTHAHPDFQESFFVIEGEVVVKSETQTYTARKGSFVNIPQGGVVHDFKNESDTVAHLLCVVVPAGLEAFFQEIGKPVAAGQFLPPPTMTPDMQQRMKAIAEKHGQKIYPPDYLDK